MFFYLYFLYQILNQNLEKLINIFWIDIKNVQNPLFLEEEEEEEEEEEAPIRFRVKLTLFRRK